MRYNSFREALLGQSQKYVATGAGEDSGPTQLEGEVFGLLLSKLKEPTIDTVPESLTQETDKAGVLPEIDKHHRIPDGKIFFKEVDRNRNGSLSPGELERAINSQSLSTDTKNFADLLLKNFDIARKLGANSWTNPDGITKSDFYAVESLKKDRTDIDQLRMPWINASVSEKTADSFITSTLLISASRLLANAHPAVRAVAAGLALLSTARLFVNAGKGVITGNREFQQSIPNLQDLKTQLKQWK